MNGLTAEQIVDGFWLSQPVRSALGAALEFDYYYLLDGQIRTQPAPGALAVRMPRLDGEQWRRLLAALQSARKLTSRETLVRWNSAIMHGAGALGSQLSRFSARLSAASGYSEPMIFNGFFTGELDQAAAVARAVEYQPALAGALRWQQPPQLPGQVKFWPGRKATALTARLRPSAPFYRPPPAPASLAIGFAAGNVPGTGMILSFISSLANAAFPSEAAPAVLIRNSRHEPLFMPWLLAWIEQIDPELASATAVLGWDYSEQALQRWLISSAGFMLAAAGDDTIQALERDRLAANPHLRFHKHGHKISFSAVGQAQAALEDTAEAGALDSAVWDQNGCLSARVHFVAGDADLYAEHLAQALRRLDDSLPRGATPLRFAHRAFDTYHTLAQHKQVRLFSAYDDGFTVAVDRRAWQPADFQRVINSCMGRVVVVRPVSDLRTLGQTIALLPPANLQTLSLAVDAGQVLELAETAGRAGVTSIRRLGEAAFPRLAGSWDGYLPSDAAFLRPPGYWTAVEFSQEVPTSG